MSKLSPLTLVNTDESLPDTYALSQAIEELGDVIGAIKFAVTGLAAAIDCGDHLESKHVSGLFSLIISELTNTHKHLSDAI